MYQTIHELGFYDVRHDPDKELQPYLVCTHEGTIEAFHEDYEEAMDQMERLDRRRMLQ